MTEDIKSYPYGTDVFTVNLFFRDGLILLQKYFKIQKYIKAKISTQF